MFQRNDPFHTLFHELSRAFDATTKPVSEQSSRWTPAVDAFVAGDSFHLNVYLAGVDPKSVELTATGNRLTIKGNRERKLPKDARDFRMNEVVFGAFERTIELPEGTDANKAEASFDNGVLDVKLPAAGAFVPKKIEIKNGFEVTSKAA